MPAGAQRIATTRLHSLHDFSSQPPRGVSLKRHATLSTVALCVMAWCAVLSTVALCVVAGMVAWAADSVHIIKHMQGGDPTPFVHYTNKDNWLGWPNLKCLHDGPGWAGGCEQPGASPWLMSEEDVIALYRQIRNNYGQFTVGT